MKIKEGFILRKIANNDMVVPIGNNIADFNGVISLNETAAFLWRHLLADITLPELTNVYMQQYGISTETAKIDTECFLMQLKRRNMLENYG